VALFIRTRVHCSYTETCRAPIGQNEQEPDRSQREKAGLLYIYIYMMFQAGPILLGNFLTDCTKLSTKSERGPFFKGGIKTETTNFMHVSP
jgi:hypothetical protein